MHLLCCIFFSKRADSSQYDLHQQKARQLATTYPHPYLLQWLKNLENEDHEESKEGDAHPYRFSFRLFGEFTMNHGGQRLQLETWGTKQARVLLLYMLMHPQWQVSKEIMIEDLFDGGDLSKSTNRLNVTIHRVNRLLQKSFLLPAHLSLIYIKQGVVRIDPELVEEVDVQTYRKLISISQQLWVNDREVALELMNKACGIYSSDVFPGFLYVDWFNEYRDELREIQCKTLSRLAQFYQENGKLTLCEDIYLHLLKLDPFQESYYEKYIYFLLSLERQAEAYQWYQKLKKELEQGLGISPTLEWKDCLINQ